MKFIINCPVCHKNFDTRTPAMHIRQHHKDATDHKLVKIRNARRNADKRKQPRLRKPIMSDGSITARGYALIISLKKTTS